MNHDGATRMNASAPVTPHVVASVLLRLAGRHIAIAPSGLAPVVPSWRTTLQPIGASKAAVTVTLLHVDRCVHTPAALAILAVATAFGRCRRRRNGQHKARSQTPTQQTRFHGILLTCH